jgi:DNA-binding SARP family transcriptional activator
MGECGEAGEPSTVNVLGDLRVIVNGEAIELPQAVQRLIALVATQGRRLTRSRVAGLMWPDSSEDRAAASLRTTVWRARSSACAKLLSATRYIAIRDHVVIDAEQASEVITQIETNPEFVPLPAQLSLLEGELLPSWDEPWLDVPRQSLRDSQIRALVTLSERFIAMGNTHQAASIASAAIGLDPLRETSHLACINAHLADGDRAAALLRFRAYEQVLKAELGLSPAPEISQRIGSMLYSGRSAS